MTDDVFRVPPQKCPVCSYMLDAASKVIGDGPPEPDDFTFCLLCSALLRWDPAMRLHKVTRAEMRELDIDTLAALANTKALTQQVRSQRRARRN